MSEYSVISDCFRPLQPLLKRGNGHDIPSGGCLHAKRFLFVLFPQNIAFVFGSHLATYNIFSPVSNIRHGRGKWFKYMASTNHNEILLLWCLPYLGHDVAGVCIFSPHAGFPADHKILLTSSTLPLQNRDKTTQA